jgi:hypothetical protein
MDATIEVNADGTPKDAAAYAATKKALMGEKELREFVGIINKDQRELGLFNQSEAELTRNMGAIVASLAPHNRVGFGPNALRAAVAQSLLDNSDTMMYQREKIAESQAREAAAQKELENQQRAAAQALVDTVMESKRLAFLNVGGTSLEWEVISPDIRRQHLVRLLKTRDDARSTPISPRGL